MSAQEVAKSSNSSKKSMSSGVSPLNEEALFDPGLGIVAIPLFEVGMAIFIFIEDTVDAICNGGRRDSVGV